MIPRYRKDYNGEFVLVDTIISGGEVQQKREWIGNPVENNHISGRAAVIGNADALKSFNWRRLARHRGGLLGQKRLQTYGVGSLFDEMRFEFLVTTSQEQAAKISASDCTAHSTVYTTTRICLEYPGKFYLIPYLPYLDELALAVYLAAFDGHKEIFLFNYHQDVVAGTKNWINDVKEVIEAYPETKFFFVGTEHNIPQSWAIQPNVGHLSVREFVVYCDV